jgi:hypothetical protein
VLPLLLLRLQATLTSCSSTMRWEDSNSLCHPFTSHCAAAAAAAAAGYFDIIQQHHALEREQ